MYISKPSDNVCCFWGLTCIQPRGGQRDSILPPRHDRSDIFCPWLSPKTMTSSLKTFGWFGATPPHFGKPPDESYAKMKYEYVLFGWSGRIPRPPAKKGIIQRSQGKSKSGTWYSCMSQIVKLTVLYNLGVQLGSFNVYNCIEKDFISWDISWDITCMSKTIATVVI